MKKFDYWYYLLLFFEEEILTLKPAPTGCISEYSPKANTRNQVNINIIFAKNVPF